MCWRTARDGLAKQKRWLLRLLVMLWTLTCDSTWSFAVSGTGSRNRKSQFRKPLVSYMAGGQQRTPVECKTPPTGARVGGKEGWYWDKIQDHHPAKDEWVACPIPGVQESVWSSGCVDGRMNPDPVSSCGDLCASTEGCNFSGFLMWAMLQLGMRMPEIVRDRRFAKAAGVEWYTDMVACCALSRLLPLIRAAA